MYTQCCWKLKFLHRLYKIHILMHFIWIYSVSGWLQYLSFCNSVVNILAAIDMGWSFPRSRRAWEFLASLSPIRRACRARNFIDIVGSLILCERRTELMLDVRIKRNRMSWRKTIPSKAKFDLASLLAHVRACICTNVCVYLYIWVCIWMGNTYRDGICKRPRCIFLIRGKDHPERSSG